MHICLYRNKQIIIKKMNKKSVGYGFYLNVVVQHLSHYVIGTPLQKSRIKPKMNKCQTISS